jgi:hypothetical protein
MFATEATYLAAWREEIRAGRAKRNAVRRAERDPKPKRRRRWPRVDLFPGLTGTERTRAQKRAWYQRKREREQAPPIPS